MQKKHQAEANLARRKAELQAAKSATKLARAGGERRKVLQSLARRAAKTDCGSRCGINTLKAELSKNLVDAKDAGIVVEVDSRASSSVQPGASIISIWNIDRIWMQAGVPEDQVAHVRAGDPATIRVNALGDESFPGVVRRGLMSRTGEETHPARSADQPSAAR